jgi:hypothetical protein
MRDYTTLRRQADPDADLAWLLLLDSLVFAVEGELRWLDHVEATVLRRRRSTRPSKVAGKGGAAAAVGGARETGVAAADPAPEAGVRR